MKRNTTETKIDYTPEGKNKIEIEKLHAELVELRSRVRRWIGSLGGLLGLVTAAVSIVVTSNEFTESASKANLDKQTVSAERAKLDADRAKWDVDRAKFDRDKAEVQLEEARLKETEAAKRIEIKNKLLKDADEQFASIQAKAGEAQSAREKLQLELEKANSELKRIQSETAKLAESLKGEPKNQKEAATAHAIAATTKSLIASEQTRSVNDGNTSRVFFFVLDQNQKERALELERGLKKEGVTIGSVTVFPGKRETTPVLRYFRDVDREEAERIKGVLSNLNLDQIRVSRVIDPDSVGTGRRFQFWPTSGDLKRTNTVHNIKRRIHYEWVIPIREVSSDFAIHLDDETDVNKVTCSIIRLDHPWLDSASYKIETRNLSSSLKGAGEIIARFEITSKESGSFQFKGRSFRLGFESVHQAIIGMDYADIVLEEL